jgi:hypothetical protein
MNLAAHSHNLTLIVFYSSCPCPCVRGSNTRTLHASTSTRSATDTMSSPRTARHVLTTVRPHCHFPVSALRVAHFRGNCACLRCGRAARALQLPLNPTGSNLVEMCRRSPAQSGPHSDTATLCVRPPCVSALPKNSLDLVRLLHLLQFLFLLPNSPPPLSLSFSPSPPIPSPHFPEMKR